MNDNSLATKKQQSFTIPHLVRLQLYVHSRLSHTHYNNQSICSASKCAVFQNMSCKLCMSMTLHEPE